MTWICVSVHVIIAFSGKDIVRQVFMADLQTVINDCHNLSVRGLVSVPHRDDIHVLACSAATLARVIQVPLVIKKGIIGNIAFGAAPKPVWEGIIDLARFIKIICNL